MSEKTDDPIVYAFHDPGDGSRLLGVPRRSLTRKDVKGMDAAALREVKASPMFREVKAAKSADTKKSDAKASGGDS